MEKRGIGTVRSEKILGASWSDDNTFLTLEPETSNTLESLAAATSKQKIQMNASKLFAVPLFRNGKKWAEGLGDTKTVQLEDDEWGGWRVRTDKYKMGQTNMEIRKTGQLLGKLYSITPERHPRQEHIAKQKAMKAGKMLAWMGVYAENTDTKLAKFLCLYLVESVLVTHVWHTQLTTCRSSFSSSFSQLSASSSEPSAGL